MATKKTVTPPKAKKTKLSGIITNPNGDCQPCTWGFEATVSSALRPTDYKVKVTQMKDENGQPAQWPDGTPVLMFKVSPA